MKKTALVSLAALSVVAAFADCSSSSTPSSSDAGNGDAESVADGGDAQSVSDGGAQDSATQDSATQDAPAEAASSACTGVTAMCGFTLAQVGTPVTIVKNPGAAPTQTGGTVVPGKYVLTGVTLYGMSGTSTDTDTQTALLCNGIYQSVESTTGTLSDFNGPSFGTISTSGTNTWTESITTCSPSNVPGTPFSFGATYTATATVVSIYVSNVLRTYTLVP